MSGFPSRQDLPIPGIAGPRILSQIVSLWEVDHHLCSGSQVVVGPYRVFAFGVQGVGS